MATPHTQPQASRHKAGAFDIRNVIGALLGIYGIVLIICSFVMDSGSPMKNDADNLYAGAGMLAVAVIFMLWAKLRPIIVEE
ncbi:hypothetical protein [Corynebacterium aquilae]|uniref:Cell wall anchor protein n=1 Tax=Corynebacterium aquilae DSM 44791 TaxID=1431546 RepID=A0A1L7CFS7_9CORY|nr:hypothetical protein [Corynebacterium aquilae]APT84674.1 hypothetical protein CAQU_05875 [Corynebacterium aquilae DSM 44791]